ncbi:hypothetical protein GALMADRAFT_309287 [Galerina marginata CBS 339.88]|uniref:Transmembrane protein 135 N-terminal domain-containing protein n=1 Tax=Galerina marginata (strain CBS 339.88) TaxID=685588 RepID=A0A067TPC0_GALM3|nr:hypothetical protein GALMADRAFT_309287 [Galerina marginata CBS 339.88]
MPESAAMSRSSQEKPIAHCRQQSWLDRIPSLSDDPTHPAQIALRTYALALSLSLGPSLVPFVLALFSRKASSSSRTSLTALRRILRRELGHDGFAFAITLAVAGGAALRQYLWSLLQAEKKKPPGQSADLTNAGPCVIGVFSSLKKGLLGLSPGQQTFISNVVSSSVGILLIQSGRNRTSQLRASRHGLSSSHTPNRANTLDRTSPTLDLTLLLLVRAVDSIVQLFILQKPIPTPRIDYDHAHTPEPRLMYDKLEKEKTRRENKTRQKWTSQVDAFVFWACSARIMWCFFYEPQSPHRLPRSYVKWISTLANLDGRIVQVLQHVRAGKWSYLSGSPLHSGLLQASAMDLGYPALWGDPTVLPAYGGSVANETWKVLGIRSRPGVGGLPCEVLHGKVGSSLGLTESCTANACLRAMTGFTEALAIYLPVHFLPVLLTRPQSLMRPHRLIETLLGALRSASFLSSFISLYWYVVCLTRSLLLARLFPYVSHDFWDGPYGCVMAGCLMCGSSIWIENGRRRGEMALYVLPRAVRACLPDAWIKSGNKGVRLAERLAFILSISTLLTTAIHRPDSLRGLSRWTLAFVTNGPNAGFWKWRRRDPTVPPTPSIPPTPFTLPGQRNDESGSAYIPKFAQ